MSGASGRVPEILQIDDDPDDALFLAEGFRKLGRPVRIVTVDDSDRALRLLLDPHRPRLPDLILLDIRMPGKNGFELLDRIREAGEPLACVPVIMLSTSNSPEDVRRAYCRRANAYMQKPMDLEGYAELARRFAEFWLKAASLGAH